MTATGVSTLTHTTKHQSIEAQFTLTANGSTPAKQLHGAPAVDCLIYYNSGTGSIQMEVSTDGLSKWIPVGEVCTGTCMLRVQIPEGVFFRATVTLASSLDVTVDVFDE